MFKIVFIRINVSMDVSNVKHLDMHASSLTQTEGVSLLSEPTGLYEPITSFCTPCSI